MIGYVAGKKKLDQENSNDHKLPTLELQTGLQIRLTAPHIHTSVMVSINGGI